MNIKLSYLYRDGGNYKQFNAEVYTNKTNLSLNHILATLQSRLIEKNWFHADRWDLKDIRSFPYDEETDHDLHEFESIAETTDIPTKYDIQDLIDLLQELDKAHK